MDRVNKLNEPRFPFPDMRHLSTGIIDSLRSTFEDHACEYRDAVRIRGGFMRCCESYQESTSVHLPTPMLWHIREEINQFTDINDPNFPQLLNKYLRLVIEDSKIAFPNALASKVFITGVPYAVDSSRQFLTLVSAIFNALEHQSNGQMANNEHLIETILLQNPMLIIYLRKRLNKALERMQCFATGSTDTGMNLAILTDAICA
jgi:hypothetical protein